MLSDDSRACSSASWPPSAGRIGRTTIRSPSRSSSSSMIRSSTKAPSALPPAPVNAVPGVRNPAALRHRDQTRKGWLRRSFAERNDRGASSGDDARLKPKRPHNSRRRSTLAARLDMADRQVGEKPLDAAAFRQVIGRFMSGVVVITATHRGERRGMTVSAIASLSLDPPMIVTCLNAASATQEVVRRAGAFAVNILAEDQEHLAVRFSRSDPDPFRDLSCQPGATGAPLLPGALAVLECRIAHEVRGGAHRVLLAGVVRASADEGSPLADFRGRLRRLGPTQ